MNTFLTGKKGLIVGIANEHSIAWGCAKALREAGAELAITYQNEKAKPYVLPLAQQVSASVIEPLDVRDETQISAVFERIKRQWDKLDFLIHSIAFAPKQDLHGRVTDCSREGFLTACDISCYSLIRLTHFAEPLMTKGGSILTTTYYGSEKVVAHYNIMGPVKAALEGTVKYLAAELGEKQIRVNAISPGPVLTRAASGIQSFDRLLAKARQFSPQKTLIDIDDAGQLAAFLSSDYARHMTGNIIFVDSGLHLLSLIDDDNVPPINSANHSDRPPT